MKTDTLFHLSCDRETCIEAGKGVGGWMYDMAGGWVGRYGICGRLWIGVLSRVTNMNVQVS